MAMHRILSTVFIVAAVSFFVGSVLQTPVLAASADHTNHTKVKAKTLHVKANSDGKVAPRVLNANPVKARTATVNQTPMTVCYSNPMSTTCYYGCVPYYNAPSSGWNAPAASGKGTMSSTQLNQSPTQQQSAGTNTTVCYNTGTPSGGVTSYTWYVPATSGQAPVQTYGQPAPAAVSTTACPPVSQAQPGTVATISWSDDWTRWLSRPVQVVYEWVAPSCW